MRLTKAQREQRRIEEAFARQSLAVPDDVLKQRTEAPAEELPPGSCRIHPDWRPAMQGFGSPTCPGCVADELAKRAHGGSRVGRRLEPEAGTDRAFELWQAHVENHPSDGIEPGSQDEWDAIAWIDQARADEAEAERRKADPGLGGARLVSARSESNIWTSYYAVPGRGIVRVQ